MNKICWKGRAFKALSYGKNYKKAGRNFSGSITICHRGGGAKRLLRRIDFQRKNLARGFIERIEYDPNRTARIALVRWSNIKLNDSVEKYNPERAGGIAGYEVLLASGHASACGLNPKDAKRLRSGVFGASWAAKQHFFRPSAFTGATTMAISFSDQDYENRAKFACCPRKAPVAFKSLPDRESVLRNPEAGPKLFSVDGAQRKLSRLLSYSQFELSRRVALRPGHQHFEAGPKSTSEPTDYIGRQPKKPSLGVDKVETAFSYILASDQLKSGDEVLNIDTGSFSDLSMTGNRFLAAPGPTFGATKEPGLPEVHPKGRRSHLKARPGACVRPQFFSTANQKSGISLPLWLAPIGSVIHNIELSPGGGGKLARSAGTSAQLVKKEPDPVPAGAGFGPEYTEAHYGSSLCTIRLPSGQQQLLDLRCRATIGVVSNIDHRARILTKAGQRRWLGFRPVVRGVAMNPIDHPHGGGEGRTKGGRPSVSPWGKPTKAGFRGSRKGRRSRHK